MIPVETQKTVRYRCPNEDAFELSASEGIRYSRQDQRKVNKQNFNFTLELVNSNAIMLHIESNLQS